MSFAENRIRVGCCSDRGPAPVDGQDRQCGPKIENETQFDECQNCGGKPGTFGYCLCCDAFGLDSLIPAISTFDDWKQVKDAIEARKARKKQRREKKTKRVEPEVAPVGEVS